MEKPREASEMIRLNDIIYSSRLGGQLNHYERRASANSGIKRLGESSQPISPIPLNHSSFCVHSNVEEECKSSCVAASVPNASLSHQAAHVLNFAYIARSLKLLRTGHLDCPDDGLNRSRAAAGGVNDQG